jgi:hypothetical protein
MTIDAALFEYLDGVLTCAPRIYPMGVRPQGAALPCVTYSLVSGPTTHYSHDGPSDYAVSYQLDCWANEADAVMDLAAEVQEALDGYRGTWGSVVVGSVFLSTVLDDYEPDTRLWRRLRQAEIHYSTPAGS